MSDLCAIRVETSREIPVVSLKGEITTFSDSRINGTFSDAPLVDAPVIVADFAEVSYINSAGIAILVNLVTEAEKRSAKLRFSGLLPHYRRVMEIVGITEYVEVFDTIDEAIAARRSEA